ncbi:MAG TPA: hypothetical protein VIZ65_15405 [Cellvibrionaceae bacterium]
MNINIIRFALFWFLSASLLAEEPTLQPIAFAYLSNGAPVSSVSTVVTGFCGALRKHLDATKGYNFKKSEPLSSVADRFTPFAKNLQGKPGIQCGPDTKTRERAYTLNDPDGAYTGEFSIPFARTSTKLLINRAAIDNAQSLSVADLRIGLLVPPPSDRGERQANGQCKLAVGVEPNTVVTTSLIGQVFHNATIFECPDRDAASTALSAAVIDAYAGDEIILYNMYQAMDNRENYVIYPPVYLDGFSQEEYVVTFYNLQGSPLIQLVNDWITSPQGKSEAAKLQPQLNMLEKVMRLLIRRDNAQLVVGVLITALIGCTGYLAVLRTGWRFSTRKPDDEDSITTESDPTEGQVSNDNCDNVQMNKSVQPLSDEQFDIAVRRTDGLTEGETTKALKDKHKLEYKPHRVNNQMRIVREIYDVRGDEMEKLRDYLIRDYADKYAEYIKTKTA